MNLESPQHELNNNTGLVGVTVGVTVLVCVLVGLLVRVTVLVADACNGVDVGVRG